MVTRLDKPLRREIAIAGEPFVVTLSPEGRLSEGLRDHVLDFAPHLKT